MYEKKQGYGARGQVYGRMRKARAGPEHGR